MSARPFRILGVQQIAIGGPEKAALRRLWVDLLGVPATGAYRSERENVDEDILAVAGVEIDLMEPIDPAKSPKVHEPRLNHVGLWVDDLAAAVAWLGAEGVRFTPGGIRRGAAGHDVTFIHPKGDAASPLSGEGVLIELVQAPPDVIARAPVPRVALVTAASKGIGAAIARELRARGCELALLARGDDVHALAAELGGVAVTGSITDADALARLVDAALGRWGRIDIVIGNTGHPPKGEPLALSDADWREGYELVVESAIRLARLVTPIMERGGGGAFVHVSSYAAVRPDVHRPASSVFRAALGAWVEVHAKAVAARGIRVNAVLPGFVDSYPVGADIVAGIPMGRPGQVAELARTVAALASRDTSYVTGQCLLVDGGMV